MTKIIFVKPKRHTVMRNSIIYHRLTLTALLIVNALAANAAHTVTPISPDVVMPAEWQGEWIGVDRLTDQETTDGNTRVAARYLRHEFRIGSKQVAKGKGVCSRHGIL